MAYVISFSNVGQRSRSRSNDQKFDTIDPDDMGNTVTKYAKDVHRLEKGLPPNTGK